ncbi:hypothetical protein ACFS7Z_14155 [Pontibacter toksunensis]|uniref:Uncharacterized protein n=1 Tax=Pontibacter toksunensis TaxID=1332631 RepID=A0ABW6BX42_9BACT
MSLPKTKQSNFNYSRSGKHAVPAGNSFVAHRYNPMCPPSKRTGFVKINRSKRKSGGYASVPYSGATDENKISVNASASTYSDFIHYNYGAASDRQYPSDPGRKP